MVGYKHNIPGFKVEINSAGGIGKYQIFRSEGTHNSYRQYDFIKLPPLIAVKPALHTNNGFSRKPAYDKSALVTGSGRYGKAFKLAVIYIHGVFDFFAHIAEPRAQNYCCFRYFGYFRPYIICVSLYDVSHFSLPRL